MNRKEFIEWLEGLQSDAARKMDECTGRVDWGSFNYQLGKSVAYRTAIEKLQEQEKKEMGE